MISIKPGETEKDFVIRFRQEMVRKINGGTIHNMETLIDVLQVGVNHARSLAHEVSRQEELRHNMP